MNTNITLNVSGETRDLVLKDGALQILSGDETTAQAVRLILQAWLGDWDFDLAHGTDYAAIVGGNPSDGQIQRILSAAIYQETGVRHIDALTVHRDGRAINITLRATLASGATVAMEVTDGG